MPATSPRLMPTASPRPISTTSPLSTASPYPILAPRPMPTVSPRHMPTASPRPIPTASPLSTASPYLLLAPRPISTVSPIPTASPHPIPSLPAMPTDGLCPPPEAILSGAYRLEVDSGYNIASGRTPGPHPSNSSNKGGRQGALQQDVKEHANMMRKVGVCLRCSVMRDKCSEASPCNKCTKKMRKFVWGCTRSGIKDRWEYFLPSILTARLVDIRFLFYHNSLEDQYGAPFTVWFSPISGMTLSIQVRKAEPSRANLPNIVIDREHIEIQIQQWLSDRNDITFIDRYTESWQRDILTIIFHYYHDNIPDSENISQGLDLLFLTYAMIYSEELTVANTSVSLVEVSLSLLNSCVKNVILSFITKIGNEFLAKIQDLLFSKNDQLPLPGLIFCTAFLCLTVFSQNQIAIQQIAIISEEQLFTLASAEKQIREMEHQMADLLIYLCQLKAKECQKKATKKHLSQSTLATFSAQSDLFERVRDATKRAKKLGFYFQGNRRLTHIDQTSFKETNEVRVLTKLYEAMAQPSVLSVLMIDPEELICAEKRDTEKEHVDDSPQLKRRRADV